MLRHACVTVLVAAVLPTVPCLADLPGGDDLDAGALKRDVGFLASDALAGRDTGEPGIREAEKYIAKGFRKAGLAPLPGHDDYWVDFDLYREGFDAGKTTLEVGVDGRSNRGRIGVDFCPFPFSGEGVVDAPVVFAGYGITAPEYEYDDYREIDARGKIVLLLRHEPRETDPTSSFDGAANTRYALFATKAATAREHEAVGMMLVTDPLHHGPSDDLRVRGPLRLSPPERARGDAKAGGAPAFLAVHVSQETASALIAPSGRSLEQLQQALDDGASPSEIALPDVKARIAIERQDEVTVVPARNVAAFLEGRDPRLKDEWILVGGHHDHIGGYRGDGDTVYNGADDNASGTAGVMALARAFARRVERPRRSLVFVTFTAEEKGLLGSRALVEQGLIPTDEVAFMLNLDMIGRNPDKELQLYGDGYVRGLREVVESANADIGLPIDYGGAEYAGNSDHDPFYEAGIPFTFFFTGVHDDYHQLGDHADKLDYDRMESILRVAYGIVDRLAEADDRPGFIHHIAWLGARLEVLDDGGPPRAVFTGIDEASRASKAGLRAGDIVTGFGDERPGPESVGPRFHQIEPGSTVALHVRRGDEEVVVSVERAKTGYLGIGRGPVAAEARERNGLHEDEGVELRQVIADGPSERAGLRVGDILVRISGRTVGPTNLRLELMRFGAGETVDVTIIRDGERRTLPVTLGERPDRR